LNPRAQRFPTLRNGGLHRPKRPSLFYEIYKKE
jgi:hypothetical protein